MSTAYITLAVEYSDDGEGKTLGSKTVPVTVQYSGNVFSRTVNVAAGSAAEILALGSASSDDLTEFDFALIRASEDGHLEFVGTSAADNSNVGIEKDVPFILGSNKTRSYNSNGNFGGTEQNISAINYKNSGASQATVKVLALT